MANVKATDLIEYTRASKGHALAKVSLGDDVTNNGGFDADTGWNKNSGWTIANGVASYSGGSGLSISQNMGLEEDKIYKVTFDITSISQGGFYVRVGFSGASQTFSTVGTHTVYMQRGSNTFLYIIANGSTTGSVDNVKVEKAYIDPINGTLQLFEHPNNIPRIEYDSDGNLLGLLIEESRTNLIKYSTPDSNWITTTLGTGVTPVVTLNNKAAPDGTTTAAKVVLDVGGGTTSSDRSVFLAPSANVTATNSYAGSVWLKGETGGEQIIMRHAGNATYSLFTLTTSWARYDVTETAGGSFATMSIGLKGNQTGQTATIYVWGAQLEAGSFPTSYIKTTGSTATRSADVASIDVDQFGYNQNEGTLFVEAQMFIKDVSYKAIANLNTNGSNRIRMISSSSANVIQAEITNGGTAQLSISEVIPESSLFSGALAYKQNDSSSSVNGSVEATDTSCTIPAVTKLDIMTSNSGHIKSIKYFPKRLSNAKLQELTS